MSSDVYIDVDDPIRGPTIRIGHIGTMSYYEIDFHQWLSFLSGVLPIINEHLVAVMPAAFDYFRKFNATICKETTPEYRLAMYGYYDPDWTDVLTGEEIAPFLREHIGQTWRIRVD